MLPFSFVHAADLHLDSPFIGIGKLPDEHEDVVRALREATFAAFEAVIDLCISRQVEFLLVAGDVYDGADRSLRAQLSFRDGLERLSEHGIRAFVIHGNHDPLDGWSNALRLPESVHVFKDQLESVVVERDGVPVARIHGISYPTRTIGKEFGKGMRREGDEPFQIGLFHCNVGGDQRHDPYAPRSVADLESAKLNYWALGHIHERITLRTSDPFIGYSGNTQGRHINESGPRGCLLVNVTANGKLAEPPEFVSTDQVRWERTRLDIEGMETIDDLLDAIDDRMEVLNQESDGRAVVVRITIEGRGPLHRELTRQETLTALQEKTRLRGLQRTPFIWIEQLALNTRSELDLNSRRTGQDFLGDLLRLIDEVRNSPEQLNGIDEVLKDLFQHRNGRKFLAGPDEQLLRELLDESEIRCADLLAEEED